MAGSPPTWMHRPTEQEHEEALRAQQEAGYASMSSFVREAVLRLTYADDLSPVFTRMNDVMRDLEQARQLLKELHREQEQETTGVE